MYSYLKIKENLYHTGWDTPILTISFVISQMKKDIKSEGESQTAPI